MFATKKWSLHPMLIAMALFIILGLTACVATKGPLAVTLDNGVAAFQIKGKVRKISKSKNLLTIKPPSSEEMTFKLLDSTVYEVAESMKSIKRDMGVVVTYTTDENGNQALVVKALPDGSCG